MDDEYDMDDNLVQQMIHIMVRTPEQVVVAAVFYVHVKAQLLISAPVVQCNITPNVLYIVADMFREAF
jgi:hypothetical protein